MISLLLFRRANKILSIDALNNFCYKNLFSSEQDELESHLKGENKYQTNGYYQGGINDDILCFYVIKGKPYLRLDDFVFDFSGCTFSCREIDEKGNWKINFHSFNRLFIYKPYFFDPFDDDEIDVNFGLWLMSLSKDKNKLNRVILANTLITQ